MYILEYKHNCIYVDIHAAFKSILLRNCDNLLTMSTTRIFLLFASFFFYLKLIFFHIQVICLLSSSYFSTPFLIFVFSILTVNLLLFPTFFCCRFFQKFSFMLPSSFFLFSVFYLLFFCCFLVFFLYF